jgi:ActD protein
VKAFPRIYGVVAEFKSRETLLKAAQRARAHGYGSMDAFSPLPVEGLDEILGRTWSWAPAWVLAGGILGGLTGYFMQLWGIGINYPFNIGGRPLNSWPLYIPITFELTILGGAFAAVLSLFVLNGLPRLHHPVFSVPGFERATTDAFFLCVLSSDPIFDPILVRSFFFRETSAINVTELRI